MAKVLLVEDDNNLREIYEARLAAEGYEISSAQDGEEALVVAKQAKPDLVISDVMMPKISGFEMLDILRNTAGLEHVKVIMLTALGQSEDRDRADNLGADKYLVKSQVTLEDIVKTAHELLDDEAVAASSDAAATPSPAPEAVVATEVIPMATAPDVEPVAASSAPVEPAPTTTPTDDASLPTSGIARDDTSADDVTAQDTTTEPVVTAPAEPATDTTIPATDDQVAATVPDETPSATENTTETESSPGTAAQEESLVSSQIDSFVSNLPDEVQTPAPAQPEAVISPEPAPDAPVEPAAVEESAPEAPVATAEPEVITPTAEEAAATTADDQIMANAVNELAGGESDQSTDPTTVGAPEPTVVTPTPDETIEPEAPAEQSPSDAQAEADKTNISINGKKTIQPLDSEPKPDINELLAREEAVNNGPAVATGPAIISTPQSEAPAQESPAETPAIIHQPGQSFAPQPPAEESVPVTPPEEDQPSGGAVPTAAPKEGGIDPNSIAL